MTVTHAYNTVNWSNMTTFSDFLSRANESAGNMLFTAIDVLVFLVLFVTLAMMPQVGWEGAILSAGFVGIILSLLFVYMGVMNFTIAGIFVGAILVAMIYVIWSNRYD